MPSSTSNSDAASFETEILHRLVPRQPWPRILAAVLVLELLLVAGWECFWRAHYFVPDDYEDTPAMWQIQRQRARPPVPLSSSGLRECGKTSTWRCGNR